MKAAVIGSGVAGLACAIELAGRGVTVEVFERASGIGADACSWYAGGMLAPWCERENAEEAVVVHGAEAIAWWEKHAGGVSRNGSLVIAPARDTGELKRFAARTTGFDWLDENEISRLEPDLHGRFRKALYFAEEAHLDPRLALEALKRNLSGQGVAFHFGEDVEPEAVEADVVFDCRGLAARKAHADLRGVKGEMLLIRSKDIALQRPVRLVHPRIPLYIVPRGDGLFMVGATMIESDERGRITARSMVELLNGAYAIHPAFGEAEIVEIGTDVRPAFPDNLPRVRQRGRIVHVNGLYRHGFLLAPAAARMAARLVAEPSYVPEFMDEDQRERATA